MLRHFAVITVVITAGLAMFASGENREMVVETIKEQRAKNNVKQAEAEKVGRRTVVVNGMRVAPGAGGQAPVNDPGSSGESGGGGGGGGGAPANVWRESDAEPMALAGAARSVPLPPGVPQLSALAKDPSGKPIPGSQLDRGANKGQPASKRPKPPTQAQIERLLETSRARAGGSASANSNGDSDEEAYDE